MGDILIRLYLAGPDVFRPDALPYGQKLKEICEQHGAVGLYPLDEALIDPTARVIFRSNVDLIRSADAVVANLTPFRGPSADAGTIWEVGMAYGLGLPVVGYSEEKEPYAERAKKTTQNQPEGWQIESFGLEDNLMISCGITTLKDSFEAAVVAAIHLAQARKLSEDQRASEQKQCHAPPSPRRHPLQVTQVTFFAISVFLLLLVLLSI